MYIMYLIPQIRYDMQMYIRIVYVINMIVVCHPCKPAAFHGQCIIFELKFEVQNIGYYQLNKHNSFTELDFATLVVLFFKLFHT